MSTYAGWSGYKSAGDRIRTARAEGEHALAVARSRRDPVGRSARAIVDATHARASALLHARRRFTDAARVVLESWSDDRVARARLLKPRHRPVWGVDRLTTVDERLKQDAHAASLLSTAHPGYARKAWRGTLTPIRKAPSGLRAVSEGHPDMLALLRRVKPLNPASKAYACACGLAGDDPNHGCGQWTRDIPGSWGRDTLRDRAKDARRHAAQHALTADKALAYARRCYRLARTLPHTPRKPGDYRYLGRNYGMLAATDSAALPLVAS